MDTQPTSIAAKRARVCTIALAIVGFSAIANAETRPRYGRSLTASVLGKPTTFDPHRAETHAQLTVAELVFDGLYRSGPMGEIVPELATALPTLSDDKLIATIPIRVGAFFHDGKTVTVTDVVASLERLKKGPAGWLLAAVDSLTVADEAGTLILRLRYPLPQLATILASPVVAITQAGKQPSNRKPIGTGPFVFQSLDRTRRELRFSAFDKHHRGRAYLDSLRLRWYEKPDDEPRAYEVGEQHISFRGDVAFSGREPKYQTAKTEGAAAVLSYVGFGRSHADLLGSREFRAAVSLALNRNGMKRLGTGEQVSPTVRPDSRASGAPRAATSALSAQLGKAKNALRRAASRAPSLNNRGQLNLEILVNRSRLDDIDIADKVLAALDKLGIRATVVEVSADVFDKRVRRGACDLFIGQLLAPAPSRHIEVAAAFAAGGQSWATKKLETAELTLGSAIAQFGRQLPIIPLFHRAVRAHYRTDVFGLVFDRQAQLDWANLFLFGSPTRN